MFTKEGLSLRLKQLRLDKGLTMRQLAEIIDVPFGTYAGYEYYQNRKIPPTVLAKLSTALGVTIEYLKEGTKVESRTSNDLVIFVDSKSHEERIAYIPIAAQAGYLKNYTDVNYLSKLSTYSLPGFNNGTYRMFPVEGNSMTPTYSPGDILICAYVNHYNNIKDGESYVIVSSEGVCVKRCINAVSRRGAIIIESDNTDYKPDLIPVESIIEIWQPKSRITKK